MDLLKKVQFTLFFLTFVTFPLGEAARIQFKNGVAITALDANVLLLTIVWLPCVFLRDKKFINNFLFKPALLFISACILSLLLALFHFLPSQVFIASLYLLRFVSYLAIFFIVSELRSSLKQRTKQYMIISGAVIVLFGFLQYFFFQNLGKLFYLGWDNHLYRMFSTFLDPNYLGTFLVLFTLFLYGQIKNYRSNKIAKSALWVLLGAAILGLILTYSRGAFTMMLVAISLYLILSKRKRWFFILTAIVVVIFAILSQRFYYENTNLFRTKSIAERIKSIGIALQIIQKNPLTGVGFNAYKYAQIQYGFRKNVASTFLSHADAGTDNSFLFVFATTGIIGFVSYLFLWFIVLKKVWMLKNVLLFSSFVGLLVSALFINSLFYPFIMLWYWMQLAVTDYK